MLDCLNGWSLLPAFLSCRVRVSRPAGHRSQQLPASHRRKRSTLQGERTSTLATTVLLAGSKNSRRLAVEHAITKVLPRFATAKALGERGLPPGIAPKWNSTLLVATSPEIQSPCVEA